MIIGVLAYKRDLHAVLIMFAALVFVKQKELVLEEREVEAKSFPKQKSALMQKRVKREGNLGNKAFTF
jgi:hypothetical protein